MGTRNEIETELEAIVQVLSGYLHGASMQEIREATGLSLGIRSLQRRLDKLQERGLITNSGSTRSSVYRLLAPVVNIVAEEHGYTADMSTDPDLQIPLSAAGKEILEMVSGPIHLRTPVGYQLSFLNSYRPNIDSYLSGQDKHKLAEIGATNTRDQPAGTYAKSVLERLLIDLSWNSSRLEGNTYSLLDTQHLIAQGQKAESKDAADGQMILNHKEAIEFIVEGAEEISFNMYTVTNLHAILSDNLLPDPAASGRIRTFSVGITGSAFTPLSIPQLIDEMFRVMLDKAEAIDDPFEQAFFIMVHLPYLQPFDDVNKRVSRLAANIPLNQHNLSPLAFVDVPEELYVKGLLGIYELNRVELMKDVFMWSYERSALRYAAIKQSLGEPDPLRIQYRELIRGIIKRVIIEAMGQKQAARAIEEATAEIPAQDRQKFVETVDTELLSLHAGNFARFRIKPSEFKAWQEIWRGKAV